MFFQVGGFLACDRGSLFTMSPCFEAKYGLLRTIESVNTGHVGTAATGCPGEQSSPENYAVTYTAGKRPAELRSARTAGGGCPHMSAKPATDLPIPQRRFQRKPREI